MARSTQDKKSYKSDRKGELKQRKPLKKTNMEIEEKEKLTAQEEEENEIKKNVSINRRST